MAVRQGFEPWRQLPAYKRKWAYTRPAAQGKQQILPDRLIAQRSPRARMLANIHFEACFVDR